LQQNSKTLVKDINLLKTTQKFKKNPTIFGYFYCEYRSKYYYWKSLIFFTKFFLTLILTLDQKIGENYKWIMVLIILFWDLGLTIKEKPYKIKFINKLESFSLITCLISSFISAFAVSDGENIFKTMGNIFGIVFNLIFYIAAVIIIIYDFSLKFKGFLSKLKMLVFSKLKKVNLKKVAGKQRNVKLSMVFQDKNKK